MLSLNKKFLGVNQINFAINIEFFYIQGGMKSCMVQELMCF
jgi:hypothetical protein